MIDENELTHNEKLIEHFETTKNDQEGYAELFNDHHGRIEKFDRYTKYATNHVEFGYKTGATNAMNLSIPKTAWDEYQEMKDSVPNKSIEWKAFEAVMELFGEKHEDLLKGEQNDNT